jgi:hypothetical protein
MKVVLLLLSLFAPAAYGQTEKCTIPIDTSPVIRGLKLGMARDETLRLFGKPFIDEKDAATYTPSRQALKGMQNVLFFKVDFINNVVARMRFQYDDSTKWESGPEFGRIVANNLKLPDAWTFDNFDDGVMPCIDFEVRIEIRPFTTIEISNPIAFKQKADYDKSQSEKIKKAFKP